MKKNSDFNYVFKKGQPNSSRLASFCFAPTKNLEIKIGIVVSKKIGNSVTRNHTKRLFRESIQKYIGKIKCGYKIVIVARTGAENATLSEVDAFVKLNLIKNNLVKENENI